MLNLLTKWAELKTKDKKVMPIIVKNSKFCSLSLEHCRCIISELYFAHLTLYIAMAESYKSPLHTTYVAVVPTCMCKRTSLLFSTNITSEDSGI